VQAFTGVPDNCDQGVPPRTTRYILPLVIVGLTMINVCLFGEIVPGTTFAFGAFCELRLVPIPRTWVHKVLGSHAFKWRCPCPVALLCDAVCFQGPPPGVAPEPVRHATVILWSQATHCAQSGLALPPYKLTLAAASRR
jgi:hypothetical protein